MEPVCERSVFQKHCIAQVGTYRFRKINPGKVLSERSKANDVHEIPFRKSLYNVHWSVPGVGRRDDDWHEMLAPTFPAWNISFSRPDKLKPFCGLVKATSWPVRHVGFGLDVVISSLYFVGELPWDGALDFCCRHQHAFVMLSRTPVSSRSFRFLPYVFGGRCSWGQLSRIILPLRQNS